MNRHSTEIKAKIRNLRSLGKTYGEINQTLGIKFPKSTLSEICRGTQLPSNYSERIKKLDNENLARGRLIALEINKIKREEFLEKIVTDNFPLSLKINDPSIAKIALAMLCLGEASKYKNGAAFYIGNSDPRIIVLFLSLLKKSFAFDLEKIRCSVQCRADQNPIQLKKYWSETTGIPERLFYDALIDPRTKGRPTKKLDYKGVLRVNYFDSKVQIELETLAELLYNQVSGPVVYR